MTFLDTSTIRWWAAHRPRQRADAHCYISASMLQGGTIISLDDGTNRTTIGFGRHLMIVVFWSIAHFHKSFTSLRAQFMYMFMLCTFALREQSMYMFMLLAFVLRGLPNYFYVWICWPTSGHWFVCIFMSSVPFRINIYTSLVEHSYYWCWASACISI